MKQNDPLSMAGLVHDLNNVFQTLVGVAMQLEETPESAHLAATVLRSVERAQRIAADMQNEQAASADFAAILDRAEAFLGDFQAAARGPVVRIVRSVDPSIELDGQWAWERVLINLFLNSARAMPDGGAIHVTARNAAQAVEIVVADEGSGIAAEVREHLFEPHVSANGSTGLGLNVVRSIVLANGGEIRAGNGERLGAVFTILLPASRKLRTLAAAR